MIYIKEQAPPLKMSGRSSFLINFNYDEQIIGQIKTLPTYYYHKATHSWEIPVIYLSLILDKLTKIDDIELSICSEENQTLPDEFLRNDSIVISQASSKFNHDSSTISHSALTESEIAGFHTRPFDHQIEAINFLLLHGKSLLLDSMGVGKSLSMMCYAETLHKRGLIDHCLIICGIDSLRSNWKNEIKKFSNETCMVLGEHTTRTGSTKYDTIAQRVDTIKNTPIEEFFVIVNIATVRNKDFLDAINSPKSVNHFGLICVDEAHKISATSDQGKNIMRMKSTYKVAATGTLITNNPISAFGPLVFAEQENATLTTYKSIYCEFGGFSGYDIVGFKNLELLKDEIDSCSIRRTLADVRTVDSDNPIPLKTIETELIEMDEPDRKFYEAIKAGVKEEADKIDLKASNLLALTTRLRQATECPGVLTSTPQDSTKVIRAAELVKELADQGEKVVVFSVFKDSLNQLKTLLSSYHPLFCTGDVADNIIEENIYKFRTDPNELVLLGTHSKMGTGFSFPECHYMIMLSTPWTYALFSQSCDRIYRITSTQNVFIKVLLCKDTLDERVMDLIETKKELSDYLVDGVENTKFTDALRALINAL